MLLDEPLQNLTEIVYGLRHGEATSSTNETRDNGVQRHGHHLPYRSFLQYFEQQTSTNVGYRANTTRSGHLLRTAPLFSSKVHRLSTQHFDEVNYSAEIIQSEFGLLGRCTDQKDRSCVEDGLIFSNTNEPWSAFICGSQGSGKSHTLSCLLENALLKDSPVKVGRSLLAGMVFHYDKFSSTDSGQVCEAAYLCSSGIPVTVLVSATSAEIMKKRYENLSGLTTSLLKPRVIPLLFKDDQLSTDIMMTLMAVDDVGERTPLYIASIRQLLRQMILDKPNNPVFDYKDFLRRLDKLQLTKDQLSPLSLRLDLLNSMLVDAHQQPHLREVYDKIWRPAAGSLTIVDLSDMFVTESDACALFSICLKLFMGGWQSAPRIIALDEAHKFLRSSPEAQKLTTDMISIIRQQRHLGARVVVATQEPTVSAELLSLCNASIVHRFTSPDWYGTLRQHLVAAHGDAKDHHLLQEIAELDTGEALVFCPTAVLTADPAAVGKPKPMGNRYFKMAVRGRISSDGGKSVVTSDTRDTVDGGNLERKKLEQTDGSSVGGAPLIVRKEGGSIGKMPKETPVYLTPSHGSPNPRTFTADEYEVIDVLSKNADKKKSSACDTTVPNAKSTTTSADPIAINVGERHWTESELEGLIYDEIRNRLGANTIKNPWPVITPALLTIEKKCVVPARCFIDGHLSDQCKDRRLLDMTKRLLKIYYDERQVPLEKRGKSWLRG